MNFQTNVDDSGKLHLEASEDTIDMAMAIASHFLQRANEMLEYLIDENKLEKKQLFVARQLVDHLSIMDDHIKTCESDLEEIHAKDGNLSFLGEKHNYYDHREKKNEPAKP